MKKLGKKFGESRFKSAWEKLMHSTQKKLSRGAENINKIIAWARNDNWRRKQKEFKQKGEAPKKMKK